MKHVLRTAALVAALTGSGIALAWGSAVHREVTAAALERLRAADGAEWLKATAAIQSAEFHANQPDRWRGWPAPALRHENDPDHFLDAELLGQFGLTLETVPPLRSEYVRAMAVAKHTHPEQVEPYDAAKDAARTQEWPGFVLHAIAEHYAKLQAALNQVRIIESLGDPGRKAQLADARAIAIYHFGALSHFVADVAQPLHTTKHYNGWVGENPKGYKWRERFHNYVDEGWARTHKIDVATIRAAARDATINAENPWDDVLTYFKRSHAELDRLYALERDGQLDGESGRKLILERLGDAAGMLTALIQAAYESSAPTKQQIEKWAFYDNDGQAPAVQSQPTTQPTTRPATP